MGVKIYKCLWDLNLKKQPQTLSLIRAIEAVVKHYHYNKDHSLKVGCIIYFLILLAYQAGLKETTQMGRKVHLRGEKPYFIFKVKQGASGLEREGTF